MRPKGEWQVQHWRDKLRKRETAVTGRDNVRDREGGYNEVESLVKWKTTTAENEREKEGLRLAKKKKN